MVRLILPKHTFRGEINFNHIFSSFCQCAQSAAEHARFPAECPKSAAAAAASAATAATAADCAKSTAAAAAEHSKSATEYVPASWWAVLPRIFRL